MKEFNWDEFKKEKIAVHCNTMQGTKDFINKCYENNINWYDASKPKTLSFLCENYDSNRYFDSDYNNLGWDKKSFYTDRGYKIIEWDDNEIIGLHFEFNVGVELGTQYIMSFKDIQELIENKFSELLQEEGLIPLGGKCDFIRKNNEYGIKVREDV